MNDSRKSVLLVEGITDEYFVREFLKNKKLNPNFEILCCGGEDKLKTNLKTLIRSDSAYKKVWVIIDADIDAIAAWHSLRDIVVKNNQHSQSINNKSDYPNRGVISPNDSSHITVGVWIMPNNVDAGMLENFIINHINTGDTLLKEADSILDELQLRRSQHKNLFKEVHLPKAKICTWFSWQERPGMPLHKAIERKLILLDSELCQQFTEWLKQLNDDR